MTPSENLVEVIEVKKYYPLKKRLFSRLDCQVKAVDGVSFSVRRGETLGLVGESGCGKTSLGKVMVRLIEASEGKIIFEGKNILDLSRKKMRRLRREMQIIFQDPDASLNPRLRVEEIVAEPLLNFGLAHGAGLRLKVKELLEIVGLSSYHARRYPHEFSGGQRQRIGIARALALNPKLIICDEPVSALDVSIQAQILNLLADLQKEFGLTYVFIAHGLAAVKHISHRVGVMYLGKMVEMATAEEIYRNPLHPYTRALMSAIPVPDPGRKEERIILTGDVPSPVNPPPGCRFHSRCPEAGPECPGQEPKFIAVGDDHYLACHRFRSF